jgi:hypothetical protein
MNPFYRDIMTMSLGKIAGVVRYWLFTRQKVAGLKCSWKGGYFLAAPLWLAGTSPNLESRNGKAAL